MSTAYGPERPLLTLELLDDIGRLVQPLKEERDLWKARVELYKAAFEDQTRRLQEAVDLCIATATELELERRRAPSRKQLAEQHHVNGIHSQKFSQESQSSYTLASKQSLQSSHTEFEWQSNPVTQANFGHVEKLVSHEDFLKARDEIDRILPGRLSNEARVEGLLLKSTICRGLGPDWVLEALAQCSEALTLCDNINSLEFLLPKIQYHRGLCLLRLHELEQARDAFAAVGPSDPLYERAGQFGEFCDEELHALGMAKRRSAFDERRTITEDFLSQFKISDSTTKHRRSSFTRSRLFSNPKPSRRSISNRWRSTPAP